MQVSDSLIDVVGNTPLVRLGRMAAHVRPQVLAKVEYLNPGGSVKDRIALAMVEDAEARGLIRPGGTIVEPTSGNTGVGLALVANARGYSCVFVMPDKMSAEKIAVLRAYGAEVVVCPTAVGAGAPRLVLLGVQAARRGDPRCLEPRPVREPAQPGGALPQHRAGGVDADGWAGHPLRRRRRHRRHDQRHRALPQGGQRGARAGRRRRPGGLGLLGRERPAVPRRGRGGGLLAGDVRPDGRRPHHRRSATATPSSPPAGWPARRRCWSAGPAGSRPPPRCGWPRS